jgi:ribosomal protein L3
MDALLEPGTTIDARHFVPGQYIDIIATSHDKGFQGGMKRWGFGGQVRTTLHTTCCMMLLWLCVVVVLYCPIRRLSSASHVPLLPQPATHGNSLAHRSIGSIGCAQTPGKVRLL